MWIGPPNVLAWPKPMSSMRTIRTFGAPCGRLHLEAGGRLRLARVDLGDRRVRRLREREHRAIDGSGGGDRRGGGAALGVPLHAVVRAPRRRARAPVPSRPAASFHASSRSPSLRQREHTGIPLIIRRSGHRADRPLGGATRPSRQPDAGEAEAPLPAALSRGSGARDGGRAPSPDQPEGLRPRALEQVAVAEEVGDAEGRHAPLPRAEEVAGAADLEVLLRDREAVLGRDHDVEPRARHLGQPPVGQEHAGRGRRAAARRARAAGGAGRGRSARRARSPSRVAFGTSTPTSMTVVATSTWISPREKAPIASSFSALFMRPWRRPTRTPGSAAAHSAAASVAALTSSSFSDSSTSG